VTLGFDISGSRLLERLNQRPGVETKYGRMLGERTTFSGWTHLLGRSASFWKPDTRRLYVQAKLADPGELCPPEAAERRLGRFYEQMAVVGLESYEEPWVTRLDVAVDVECAPDWGKSVLDGLAGARLSNGWRVTTAGQPRSTIYFRARAKDTILARAYCRNLKTREGEPFGRIRLEASDRFKPLQVEARQLADPAFARLVWDGRYGSVSVNVVRIERETQVVQLASMVELGELTYARAERMSFFLDAERLGVASRVYPQQVLSRRRAEAREIGLQGADAETVNVNLLDALAPFRSVWQ
jgi:hypothetical protein